MFRNEPTSIIEKNLSGVAPDRAYESLPQASIDYEVFYEDAPFGEADLILLKRDGCLSKRAMLREYRNSSVSLSQK